MVAAVWQRRYIAPSLHARESKCRKLENKVGSLQRISPRGSQFKHSDGRADRYTVLQPLIVGPNGCDPRHRPRRIFYRSGLYSTVQMRLPSPVFEALCRRTFQLVLHFLARSQNCETRLSASSCLSVCPFVRLHGTARLLILLIFRDFWKICRGNSSFIQIWHE